MISVHCMPALAKRRTGKAPVDTVSALWVITAAALLVGGCQPIPDAHVDAHVGSHGPKIFDVECEDRDHCAAAAMSLCGASYRIRQEEHVRGTDVTLIKGELAGVPRYPYKRAEWWLGGSFFRQWIECSAARHDPSTSPRGWPVSAPPARSQLARR